MAEKGFSKEQLAIMQQLREAALKYGLDPNHVLTVASIESSFNPSAKNGLHTGLFQFGPSEWKTYGTGQGDAMAGQSVDDQVLGFKNYQDVLRKQLAASLGREPTLNELYLAHQQGGAGALSLIHNNQRPATSVVPSGNIVANAGTDADTGQQFIDRWNQKYGAHAALVGGQPLDTGGGGQVSTQALSTPPSLAQAGAQAGADYLNSQAPDKTKDKGLGMADFAKMASGGAQAIAQQDAAANKGPPPMPNLPAHRPDMANVGLLNPFSQQGAPVQGPQAPGPQMAGLEGGMSLLSPMGPNPNNDPRLRKLMSGLLSGA